ncbi:unnamed protein product [Caenorhabditis angaria]|uniref:Uncharacterized protein n=1 Tax=Caenorhabditis angaria TaxID=860376 RepID=A0A9P1MYA9_9PELO|nr:unnamed protein product [Caenorhabditis angaria]
MKFVIFALVYCISAAPLVQEPLQTKKNVEGLTVEAFDGYVGVLKMFKDMLPGDLMNTLDSLNMTQKGELVTFLTGWFQDKIKKPTTKAEIVELFKDHLPSVYEKINFLNTTFYDKFNALKPETQTLLRQWKDKAIDLTSETNSGDSASKQLQLLRDFATSVQNMDTETREDLRTQFPSAVSLTEGLGFTVFTTIAMVLQKVIESVSQAAAPISATVASAVECAIPLDK